MKVVHLWANAGPRGGGGGVAMGRLHEALLATGVDSVILEEASDEIEGDPRRSAVPRWRLADGGLRRLISPLGLNDVHRISSFALVRNAEIRSADVLHVHGTHSGFLNYLTLPLLTRKRSALFTLHDMWAVTGHCAYSLDCERWRDGCGSCPYPTAPPRVSRDATGTEWKLKRAVYARSRIGFAAPSRWLRDIAAEGLPEWAKVEHIPNGVDTDRYRPTDQAEARAALGIPADRHVLMFASVNLADWRKGGDLLTEMIAALPESVRERTVALLIGPQHEDLAERLGVPVHPLGLVTDEEEKVRAYNASDLFILPTRADNDPLVLIESLACGTPVASFEVGGVPETVESGVSGLLAAPEQASDLAAQIAAVLESPERLAAMGDAARRQMVEQRGLGLWVDRHLEAYEALPTSRAR